MFSLSDPTHISTGKTSMQSPRRSQDSPCARVVVSRGLGGEPRTYRFTPTRSRASAYRRLALSILRVDIATLSAELRAARTA